MTNSTVGRVAWGDKSSSSVGSSTKEDFFRLSDNGVFRVKLLGGAPVRFAQHWVTKSDGGSIPVRCPKAANPKAACTFCNEADKLKAAASTKEAGKAVEAKVKFAIEAYMMDANIDKPVIFEFPKMVYDKIGEIMSAGVELDKAVLVVTRNVQKGKGAIGAYAVVSVPDKAFTPEQQAKIVAFRERGINVETLFAAPSDEENVARVRSGGGSGSAPTVAAGEEAPKDAWTGQW